MKTNSSTNRILASLSALTILLLAVSVKAVPYASAIKNNGATISFILNESADNVNVVFNDGETTISLGARGKGQHSFNWAGYTNFQIVVTKAAPPGWTQISSDTNVFNQFFGPRGLAVNINPANSALFGRTYVANPIAGVNTVTGARATGKGLYILNPDQSDALGREQVVTTTGIAFESATGNPVGGDSPWRIAVGPDNHLYVADYSTNAATLYRMDPDVTTNQLVFQGVGINANTTVHRSIGSVVIRGTLEGGDFTVYAHDGNMSPFNSVKRWDIGAGPLPHNSPPGQTLTGGRLGVAHLQMDLDLNLDGTKFYESINRSASNNSDGIRVYDSSGAGLLWGSLTEGTAHPLWGYDPFFQARGFQVSPDGTKIAVIRDDNSIAVAKLTNDIPDLETIYYMPAYAASPGVGRDVCFDAAGNLYAISSGRESLRIFSPGGTTTATTRGDATGTNGTFNVTTDPFPDPYILFHPLPQITGINSTNPAIFKVLAGGTGPFTYQWQSNGIDIAGATSNTLTLTNFSAGGGDFSAVVTGASGSVTSSAATLTVATAPVILGGAPTQSVIYSSNATFRVNAVGATPFSYQWYFNGASISGATAIVYTKNNVTGVDAGNYYAVVSNSYGFTTSAVGVLTVLTSAPSITVQPQSVATNAGVNVTFAVTATALPTANYQWRFNGANIASQTNSTLIRTNVQTTTLAGYYDVVLSNAVGVVTSAVASLTIIEGPPIITGQPTDATINSGTSTTTGNSTLRVTTYGTDPRTYQWQLAGTNIMGATSSVLARANVQQAMAGYYQVFVSNAYGTAISDFALITVADTEPIITASSVTRTVPAGSNVLFSVTTRGIDPRFYQWKFNGADIAGATNSTFTLTNAQPANSGTYVGVITNSLSSVPTTTTNIGLTVTNTPVIIFLQPVSVTNGAGSNLTFTVGAWGNEPRTYQWYRGGVAVSGATTTSLTIMNAQLSDSGSSFYVTVQNPSNTVQSSTVTLTITNRVPFIIVQPTNQFANLGASATFSVTAQGQAPLGYQWRAGTNNIAGATNATLILNNVQLTDATNYSVVVSTAAGSVTSQSALLAVVISSTTGTGTGLVAQYFADQYLGAVRSNTVSIAIPPTVTRTDTNVDINFGTGSPDPSVPPDFFIARWYGQVEPRYTQPYTFYTRTDDGCRLWINGTLVVDRWQTQSLTEIASTNLLLLTAGQKYNIRMEYFEQTSSGEAHLLWSSPSQFKEPIAMSQLYPQSAPFVMEPPSNVVVNPGESATFNVVAGGTGPLSYQLLFNGTTIVASDSTPSFTLNNVQITEAGNYSIIVANSFGSTTSLVAKLTVVLPANTGTGTGLKAEFYSNQTTNSWYTNSPTLTRIDPTVDFNFGTSSPDVSISANTFTARWWGRIQPKYSQVYTFNTRSDDGFRLWVDGQLLVDRLIPGGTNVNNYAATMPYAFTADQQYDIRVDYYEGTSTAEAHLYWSSLSQPQEVVPMTQLYPESGPFLIVQPTNRSAIVGASASFSVIAGGTPALSYQWKKNGANISGATNTLFTIPNVQVGDAANYSVVVTSSLGTTTSTNALLAIPPAITTQPQSQSVNVGSGVTFNVAATGVTPLDYQWRFNGTNIGGATGSSYSIGSAQLTDAGNYVVVITNIYGTATSSTALLTVIDASPPAFGSPSVSGGNIILNWSATPGRVYRVQYKPNLSAASWTDIPPDITAVGSSISITNPIAGPESYYRVILLP